MPAVSRNVAAARDITGAGAGSGAVSDRECSAVLAKSEERQEDEVTETPKLFPLKS